MSTKMKPHRHIENIEKKKLCDLSVYVVKQIVN